MVRGTSHSYYKYAGKEEMTHIVPWLFRGRGRHSPTSPSLFFVSKLRLVGVFFRKKNCS